MPFHSKKDEKEADSPFSLFLRFCERDGETTLVSTENLKSKKGAFVTEWDPATGAVLRTRKIHNKPVTAMVVRSGLLPILFFFFFFLFFLFI